MALPPLKSVFESVFHGQVYELDGVGYDVPKLTYFAEENYPAIDIPLKDLTMSKSDEKHGSKEFKKHAKKVKHKVFPIVTVSRNDGILQIADGNHRAWRAAEEGELTIKGYIIPQDELPTDAIVDDENTDRDEPDGED